jgi:alpha-beta hydrolase superfamily lysophospholipase
MMGLLNQDCTMQIWRESFPIAAADKALIAVHRWRAHLNPRGVVLIAHGMGEHALRYDYLACCLAKAGYVVYANDHRGHGQTVANQRDLGDLGPKGLNSTASDMRRVVGVAQRLHPHAPIVLLGNSLGSYAAQLYATDHSDELAGIVLVGGSALDLRVGQLGAHGWRYTDNNASFSDGKTSYDWVSRDPTVVRAYIDDPMCRFSLSVRSQKSLIDAGSYLYQPTSLHRVRVDLPILVLSGEHDPCNAFLRNFHALLERYHQFGFRDVSSFVYGSARHDLFNEINRDEVIGDLIGWLTKVTTSQLRLPKRLLYASRFDAAHGGNGLLH